jgi:hypothetical protein
MLLNVMFKNIFDGYSEAISNGAETTLAFILDNKRAIVNEVGFFGFKQFTLNYRIYFDNKRKDRIIKDLHKYVLSKEEKHKSDLAIGHNAITKLHLPRELEIQIVEFMFDRMKDTYLVKYKHLENLPNSFVVKKHLVIDYVYTKILRKKGIR